MSEKYIERGYVKSGYAEGDIVIPDSAGEHPMKFFVSSGKVPEAELKANISASLGAEDIAVVYVQEGSKILLGGQNGFIEFLGGVDINSIVNSPEFIRKVRELSSVTFNADIVAPDGSTIVGATVNQTAPTTFEVTIPQELVGTSYNIVFSES